MDDKTLPRSGMLPHEDVSLESSFKMAWFAQYGCAQYVILLCESIFHKGRNAD